MSGFEKTFRMVAMGGSSNNHEWLGQTHNALTVATAGWHTPAEGAEALAPLEVGDRVEDRDGDTWERIA